MHINRLLVSMFINRNKNASLNRIIISIKTSLPLICKELNGTRHTRNRHFVHLILLAECVPMLLGPNPQLADS